MLIIVHQDEGYTHICKGRKGDNDKKEGQMQKKGHAAFKESYIDYHNIFPKRKQLP